MRSKIRILALSIMLMLAASVFVFFQLTERSSEGMLRALPRSVRASLGVYAPETNTCPVCMQSSPFIAADGRPRRFCPVCGSLERHRLLYLYLRQRTKLFTDPFSVLHFSPERGLSAVLAAQRNLRYATSWYEPDRTADYHLDLTALALPDNSWDVLIIYHVLEHITDDRTAMREMFRVLKPGGWAVVQSPTREQPGTLEDPSIDTPAERDEKYGYPDHVRYYGWQDFADRLTAAGFQVKIERFGQEVSAGLVREFALDRNERIYLVRKPL